MFVCLSGWIGFHSTPALTPLCQEGIKIKKKNPAIFTDRREKNYQLHKGCAYKSYL